MGITLTSFTGEFDAVDDTRGVASVCNEDVEDVEHRDIVTDAFEEVSIEHFFGI